MTKPPADPEYRWSLRFEAGRIIGIRSRATDTNDTTHTKLPDPPSPDAQQTDSEAA